MSRLKASATQYQDTTPPTSFAEQPLTPPPTDEKQFAHAHRVISLFREIRAGRHIERGPWTEFWLVKGEYDEIQRLLQKDEDLWGYVKDKIRHDYNAEKDFLVVRMPTSVHELFVDGVEDAIRSQLKVVRSGSGPEARFAQKVRPARSTEIKLPAEEGLPSRKSKYEPDASFWHDDAKYPGVIIEIAYSQKRKRLYRLAESYLLDSDASVQVVVGLDIEYGKKGSREATLSVWRAQVIGNELRVVDEVADETFRGDQGNNTDHPGLQLHLSDFAHEELVQEELGDQNREINVSGQQLCQFLAAAENKVQQDRSLSKHLVAPGIRKRKRPDTPPEEIASSDEAQYMEQERKVARRMEAQDPNYEDSF
ncbi:unnamed protein product [Periconia digitata]|uniref:Uncharacterized protein n=1 Tax=Periconia digitata TaxID=1303443 RepID=A0A9W4XXC3_9PLEO|nr:unnamed protein product [Periconia digitata]